MGIGVMSVGMIITTFVTILVVGIVIAIVIVAVVVLMIIWNMDFRPQAAQSRGSGPFGM